MSWRSAKHQSGIKTAPLFNAIEPSDYLTLIMLHCVNSFVNTLWAQFMLWIKLRLENRPAAVIVARQNYLDSLFEVDKQQQLAAEAEGLHQQYKLELADVKAANDADPNAADPDYEIYVKNLAEYAEQEKDAQLELLRTAKATAARKKKAMDNLEGEKENGATTQDLRMCIEQMLDNDYNIRRST